MQILSTDMTCKGDLSFIKTNAKVAQLVEHDLAKVGVASSNLVFRSISPSIPRKGFYFLNTSRANQTLKSIENPHLWLVAGIKCINN
jgi:hypothetical protein